MFSQCGCHLLTSSVVMALNMWRNIEVACVLGRSLPAGFHSPSGSAEEQPTDVEVVLSESMEDPALAQL